MDNSTSQTDRFEGATADADANRVRVRVVTIRHPHRACGSQFDFRRLAAPAVHLDRCRTVPTSLLSLADIIHIYI